MHQMFNFQRTSLSQYEQNIVIGSFVVSSSSSISKTIVVIVVLQ